MLAQQDLLKENDHLYYFQTKTANKTCQLIQHQKLLNQKNSSHKPITTMQYIPEMVGNFHYIKVYKNTGYKFA